MPLDSDSKPALFSAPAAPDTTASIDLCDLPAQARNALCNAIQSGGRIELRGAHLAIALWPSRPGAVEWEGEIMPLCRDSQGALICAGRSMPHLRHTDEQDWTGKSTEEILRLCVQRREANPNFYLDEDLSLARLALAQFEGAQVRSALPAESSGDAVRSRPAAKRL